MRAPPAAEGLMLPLPLSQILLFIRVRRVLRAIVIAGFYGCVALALAKWAWFGHPEVHMRSYTALMVILGLAAICGGFLLRIARCPRCGGLFSVRADPKARNNFTSECMNCGLKLDGSNAESP